MAHGLVGRDGELRQRCTDALTLNNAGRARMRPADGCKCLPLGARGAKWVARVHAAPPNICTALTRGCTALAASRYASLPFFADCMAAVISIWLTISSACFGTGDDGRCPASIPATLFASLLKFMWSNRSLLDPAANNLIRS